MRLLGLFALNFALAAAPTIQTVCASGCTTTNFQTAINTAAAANSGPQIIELKAGENFDTASGFTLPARSGSYTGWIVIRSSRAGELLATTRVTPADTAKMATVRVSTGSYTPAIYTSGHPSAYWRLEGLEITLTTTGLTSYGWLVGIGYGTDTAETEPGKVSHHIVIDRCYIHGLVYDNGPRDGVRANGDNVQILNSYISEIKHDDTESHGLLGYSFNGPLLVRNTYHGGAAIGSLIGGAFVQGAAIHPQHLQFLGNYYRKTPWQRALRYNGPPKGTAVPPAAAPTESQTYWKTDTSEFFAYTGSGGAGWKVVLTGVTGNVCDEGDFWEDTTGPTYYLCSAGDWSVTGSNRTITGGTYTPFVRFWIKNAFELKVGDGALVEGNRMQECYFPAIDGQSCAAILMNFFFDQSGATTSLRDVLIRNNRAEGTAAFFQQGLTVAAGYEAFTHRHPANVIFENNFYGSSWKAANMQKMGEPKKPWYWDGYVMTTTFGEFVQARFSNSITRHNTAILPLSGAASNVYSGNNITSAWTDTTAARIDDNLIEGAGLYGVAKGPGGYSIGCMSFSDWTNSRFTKNVIVNTKQDIAIAVTNDRHDGYGCETWAVPYKRAGTGVWYAPTAASIAGGWLKITGWSGRGHGMWQGTRIKLAGWTPAGLNTTYSVPHLYAGPGSSLVHSDWQAELWLPTAEVGAVTVGTIQADVGYTDFAGGNYRLAADSLYKGWATDGGDPGADQSMVEWATASAVSGTYNPYLDFRVRSITPTADGAVIRFTAYSTAACTWTISSTRAFADSLGSVSQSRTGRDGSATISGLSANTTCWYRVTCDSTYRDGEVTTSH